MKVLEFCAHHCAKKVILHLYGNLQWTSYWPNLKTQGIALFLHYDGFYIKYALCLDWFRIKKKLRVVNHQPSSQMFDTGSINFVSCSSCFAQMNCNFVHAVNISLYKFPRKMQSQRCYKQSWWKRENKANCFSSPFIFDHSHCSGLLRCYNTALSHQRFFVPQGLTQWKKVWLSNRRWV